MGKKVVVIGIDALDSLTLSRIQENLPHFRNMIQTSKNIEFDGVFPPDSPTSWASIYTGLNPAKHGVILFVDPLSRVSTMINKDVDDTNIHGKTVWDIASEKGKKVCIIPHLLGYPVWPVNGVMVGRSGISSDVQIYPPSLAENIDLNQFRWDLDLFPGRNKKRYVENTIQQIKREIDFTLHLYRSNLWDLFFVSFGELDVIQYSFWNYYDENDPSYPGKNEYQKVIPEIYKIFDTFIGKFLPELDSDTTVIIVSDHGIGSRPVKLINVNEVLRQNNFISLKDKKDNKIIKESSSVAIKRALINIIDKYDLGNFAAIALKLIPIGKKWFISSNIIDWEKSYAYLTDQSGIKNYPYGGIMVKGLSGSNYDSIRDQIIIEFNRIYEPVSNKKIVKWILKREDLYEGEFISRYPDLIFELNEDYGAGNDTPAELFGRSTSHNIAPGCHKQHHATFLISNYDNNIIRKQKMTLMDVTPTILDLLGIDFGEYCFDGKSIFREQ